MLKWVLLLGAAALALVATQTTNTQQGGAQPTPTPTPTPTPYLEITASSAVVTATATTSSVDVHAVTPNFDIVESFANASLANARALALANGNAGPFDSATIVSRNGATVATAIVSLANGKDWVFNTSTGKVGEGASRLLAMRAALAAIRPVIATVAMAQKQNETSVATGTISQQLVRNR